MKTLNKVMLIGRIGDGPKIKHTQDTTMVRFSLATDRLIKRGDNWDNETEWHRIVAWGKIAQVCEHILSKGMQVFVEGQVHTHSWDDNGEKKYITEINAKDIFPLSYKQSEAKEELETEPITEDVPF